MSWGRCTSCKDIINQKDDPEGFYFRPDEYWCEDCRDQFENMDLEEQLEMLLQLDQKPTQEQA